MPTGPDPSRGNPPRRNQPLPAGAAATGPNRWPVEVASSTAIGNQSGDARKAAATRRNADAIVERFHGADLLALARAVETNAKVCGGREMALAIAVELRRRATVGVRIWPSLRLVRTSPEADAAKRLG